MEGGQPDRDCSYRNLQTSAHPGATLVGPTDDTFKYLSEGFSPLLHFL